jgi:uroporphyrinogen decarboxylase
MFSRREWLLGASSAALLRSATMSPIERMNHALRGEDVDRPPFSYHYHFLDAEKSGEEHAKTTLAFHDKFHTDLVKVMSDYPYPKPKGTWYELKVEQNPFPKQIRALEIMGATLKDKAYFVETIFNPWNVAEKLSSPSDVRGLKDSNPQKLLDALEVIAKSEANHARRAIQAGASGILIAIANAQGGAMAEADYQKFSEPFDRMILDAVKTAPINVLHLHTDEKWGDKLYASRFYHGWPASVLNYSLYTHIEVSDLRKRYPGVIMAGLDERKFRSLDREGLKQQWASAQKAAGKKFILAPGCSVPNDTTDAELQRLPKLLGAL